jgi:hypothetical protein
LVLEWLGAIAVLVAIIIRESRAHRVAHGFVQAGKFLSLFLGSGLVVSALYEGVYPADGLYSLSLPVGFAFGLAIGFAWYFKRGKGTRPHAT